MKIKTKHIAQFLIAYGIIAICVCIPFLFQATDTANFISMFLVLVLMLIVIVTMSYVLMLERKASKQEGSHLLDYYGALAYELNLAECDLKEYGNSGNEDWVAKQEKYIENLKAEINTLVEKL